MRTMLSSKIHRATVTESRLDYQGSITIDSNLLLAAGILPYQLVHVNNMSNAVHWETYVIPGRPDSGQICLNGCPARLFYVGDEVIIMAFDLLSEYDAHNCKPKIILVDKQNKILK